MNKIFVILVVFVLVSSGFAFANMNADQSAEKSVQAPYFERTYDVIKLIGMKVNNEQGENLGQIKSLMADAHGRIAFAILSYGGLWGVRETLVAVPFEALSYNSPGRLFVLDMSKEQLASAPKYQSESDLANPKFAEEVYKFFGQHPYWTDENTDMSNREGEAQ